MTALNRREHVGVISCQKYRCLLSTTSLLVYKDFCGKLIKNDHSSLLASSIKMITVTVVLRNDLKLNVVTIYHSKQ